VWHDEISGKNNVLSIGSDKSYFKEISAGLDSKHFWPYRFNMPNKIISYSDQMLLVIGGDHRELKTFVYSWIFITKKEKPYQNLRPVQKGFYKYLVHISWHIFFNQNSILQELYQGKRLAKKNVIV